MTSTGRRARDEQRMVPLWIITHPDLSAVSVRLWMLLDVYLELSARVGPEKIMEDLGTDETEADVIAFSLRQLQRAGAIDVDQRPESDEPDLARTVITLHRMPEDNYAGVRNLDDVDLFPSAFTLHRGSIDRPIDPLAKSQPASRRIADRLREGIEKGRWQAGDKLPSERDLAEECGVARNTAREAVRLLTTEKLVEARHGIGVFVLDTEAE